jgi:hypothetical protein
MTIYAMTNPEWDDLEQTDNGELPDLCKDMGQVERRMQNMYRYQKRIRKKQITAGLLLIMETFFLCNILAGIFWPDFLISQDIIEHAIKPAHEVVPITVNTSDMGTADGIISGNRKIQEVIESGKMDYFMPDWNRQKEYSDEAGENIERLQWDVLISYHLEPGKTIRSERFYGNCGENLVLLVNASLPEYEVRLMNGEKTVSVSTGEEICSFNLELQDLEYQLQICNTGDNSMEIELYCTK